MSEVNPYESPEIDVDVIAEEGSDLSRYNLKELNRFYYVSTTLGVCVTLLCFFAFFMLIGTFLLLGEDSGEDGLIITMFLVINSVMITACFGGYRRGRLGQISLALCGLFSFVYYPFGSVFGVILLIVLMMSFKLFGHDRIKHSEITAAISLRERKS